MADAEVADSKVKEEKVWLSAAIRPARAPSDSTGLNNGQRESRTMVLSYGAVLDCLEFVGQSQIYSRACSTPESVTGTNRHEWDAR